ncbi:MAG: disulfide oxidoreductase [Anaerolineae bacterium]|jgi:hybrid cluster-associated redox disulfide protein
MSNRQEWDQVTAECLVQDVIRRHPQTIIVFARHGLQCAGCYISPFHSISDTAREYAITIEPLLRDLNQAITES